MKIFNIEFAPCFIPLERRLQTLAVAFYMFLHLILPFLSIPLVYFTLQTKLWWPTIIYLIWCIFIDTDFCRSSRRRSEWVINLKLWRYCRDYFPIKLFKSFPKDLDASKNYLFVYYPHGLTPVGCSLGIALNKKETNKLFPHHNVYIHTLKVCFLLPFYRELIIWIGALPASRKCLNFAMGKSGGGNISCLVVGGAEEGFHFNPGVHKVILKNRKGFIKIALHNGCSLIPTYGFGENEVYEQFVFSEGSFIKKIQRAFKKLTTVALVFVKGRGFLQYSFGILPHRRPVNVVVGEPIDVEKTENPTQEQIDNLHQLFEKKLVELFESQKKHYLKDYENAHLEII